MRIVYPIDTGISVAPAEQEPAVTVTLNGTKLEFDQNPVIVDGRTLVPLRKIFEALGASVDWNDSTRTVTSSLGGTTISLTIGSDTMKKNSSSVKLDVPAQIIGDRTMVPVRAVAEAFGVNVGWDDGTKTVIIGGEPIVTDRSNESDSVLKEYAKQVTKLTYEDSGKVYTDIRFMLADMTGDGKNELLAIGFDSNNNAVPFVAYEESNGEVKELSYDFTYDKEHIITDQKFDFAPHNGGVYSLIRYEGAVYVANFGVGSKTGFSQRIARYNNGVWEFEELSRTVFDNTGIGENQYMVKGEYVSQEEYENFFNMIEGSEIITKEFVSVDAL